MHDTDMCREKICFTSPRAEEDEIVQEKDTLLYSLYILYNEAISSTATAGEKKHLAMRVGPPEILGGTIS